MTKTQLKEKIAFIKETGERQIRLINNNTRRCAHKHKLFLAFFHKSYHRRDPQNGIVHNERVSIRARRTLDV